MSGLVRFSKGGLGGVVVGGVLVLSWVVGKGFVLFCLKEVIGL